jgi:hypothetical protein
VRFVRLERPFDALRHLARLHAAFALFRGQNEDAWSVRTIAGAKLGLLFGGPGQIDATGTAAELFNARAHVRVKIGR